MKKILVVVAHADNEILGAGGTIARLAAENEVYVLIVTDSCSSQYAGQDVDKIIEEKKRCAVSANEIIGVKQVISSDLPDMRLRETPHTKINAVIEKCIDEIGPQIILTHHFGDVNLDHREVYKSVMVAARPTQYSSVEKYIHLKFYRQPHGRAAMLVMRLSQIHILIFRTVLKRKLTH